MRENLILVLKGFIIGVAKIIPGVSGAVLAISLNIYEKALTILSSIKKIKKEFKFLFLLGIGLIIAIIFTSNLVTYFLNKYYLETMLFFIGLILGGIPILIKKNNQYNYIIMFVAFIVVFLINYISKTYINLNKTYITFIIIGIIESFSMIVPGISGTAIMMILGVYNLLLNTISSLTSINSIINNLFFIIPFLFGVIIGGIIFIKLMNYLFKHYKSLTYSGIIGFSISSVFILFLDTLKSNYNIYSVLIGLLLLVIGYFISSKLEN